MRKRKILAVSPQELENGTPPDPEVDGFHGGVYFEEGVSEVVRYETALPFAARGNTCLPPEEADEKLEAVRSENDEEGGGASSAGEEGATGDDPVMVGGPSEDDGASEGEATAGENVPREEAAIQFEDLSRASLDGGSVPDEYAESDRWPGYHDALSALSDEAGVDIPDFFGGQPKKGPLMKLHYAYTESAEALLNG